MEYQGEARIDGVPGTAAPIPIDFLDVAGSSCGALLPTGNARDTIGGIEVTCIDNGMPVVVMRAKDLGQTGYETPEDMEADAALKTRVEAIRLEAGRMMNFGDVTKKTVPKMCLIAPPLTRRRGIDAQLHPQARAQGDRRVRRGQRGNGVRGEGLGVRGHRRGEARGVP